MKFDCEVEFKDVQDLASADAVAAFFAKLGYNTDARTQQTLANLGITAEGAARPINRIELLADQEGLLQVYLFEVKSVTVTHIRALARTFRNRAGNYLLVLTSDYEHLDFVLIDKELPTAVGPSKGIAQKQVVARLQMPGENAAQPSRCAAAVSRSPIKLLRGNPHPGYPPAKCPPATRPRRMPPRPRPRRPRRGPLPAARVPI